MKTPPWWVTILVVAVLLGCAALLIFFAAALPAPVDGAPIRAWNTKVFVSMAAVVPCTLAIVIVTLAVGRRADAVFALSLESDLVLSVYTSRLTREQIRAALPTARVSDLPYRVLLSATRSGLELWSRRRRMKYLEVPWSDISTVQATELEQSRVYFYGISIVLAGAGRKVEMALVGSGLLGRATREVATRAAADIRGRRS